LEFKEFGFNERVLESIEAIGYKLATPVQEQAIPAILEGKDMIASAQTGTGKTAAFLLPIINKIVTAPPDDHIKALVIVPTRELAMQIDQQMDGFSYFTNVNSIAVFGGGDGSSFVREKQALSEGADVIIGTPGRLIAHFNLGYVKVKELKYLILDEADRMLDMGFFDDIMKIISFLPAKRQNLLFSATMPKEIRELTKKLLTDPVEISIAISKPAERAKQRAFIVYEAQKIPVLAKILGAERLKSVIVFCSTKSAAKSLTRELQRHGLSANEIHSDLEQIDRNKVLASFKNRELKILVATDILSRGIDVEDIDLVVNYDVPHDMEDYVHRIGRTARAASEGLAFTFVNESEQRKFNKIEKLLGAPVPKAKLPEEFGPTPDYNPGSYSKSKDGKGKKSGKSKNFRRSNKKN
jgi:superfamily II DNA/RNA helicase